MAVQGQHSFLETVKESEAAARGANLSDKIVHAVLKAVKAASTRSAVKANQQFTLDTFVPDIVNLTKADLRRVVSRLISDKVVVQVFRLEFVPGEEQLQLAPCFLANTSDEEETVHQLYRDTVVQTIAAAESLLDALPPVTPIAFSAELDLDLASERIPPVSKLPGTLVDLFGNVHAKNFDIVPPVDLVQVTTGDIRSELMRRGRIRQIPDYGLLPVRETEVLMRLETADDFLAKKLVPKYKTRSTLKRELDQIANDETAYRLNPHAAATGQFIVRRAQALKKAVLATLPQGRGVRFPGTLAVEVILQLEPLARERFEERARSEVSSRVRDFKERFALEGRSWKESIRFVRFDEVEGFHPEVWDRLRNDPELMQGRWQAPDGLVFVFALRGAAVFRRLVEGMLDLPPDHKWQILAMRALLEEFEREPEFKALFEDSSFVASFGRLMRLAYMDRIPWFHRLLLQLGLGFLQDRAFQLAKQSISAEQERLRARNDVRLKEHRERREKERQEKLLRVQDLTRANRIIEVLDDQFLNQRLVPTVGTIRTLLPEYTPQELNTTLRKERFQIMMPNRGADPDEGVLLYPLNHEWRSRSARLRKVFERMLEEAKRGDEEEAEEVRALITKLNRFIDRTESGASNGEPGGEDPYEAFGRELEKHKGRTAAPPDAESD